MNVEPSIEGEQNRDTAKAERPLRPRHRPRILPFIFTLVVIAIAGVLSWWMWSVYMGTPWTRDATVRAYVVTLAPEVAGRVTQLPVHDNQFVHKGDLLLAIDQTDYKIAVQLAEAAVQQTQANAENAERQAKRRLALNTLAVTHEEQETYQSNAVAAEAQYKQAVARLNQAKVNLARTEIHSPVNGWVTNLTAQLGDYANVGQKLISVINGDSFWIDAYFEENQIDLIKAGDPVRIKLMGYKHILHGTVESIARGINTPNSQPNGQGLATVNPIFTWVRLAQRIPVRIGFDHPPADLVLSAGMTATVEVETNHSHRLPLGLFQ